MADATVQSLVWLTPECLIIQPPDLFALPTDLSTAVRPVHIQNVGLIASDPVDEFWKKVYEVVGVRDIRTTVESFIDVKRIRAYYNSAAFAFDPSFGLCSRWFEFFETLVCDQEFQETACQDERHQIFLHQAILSPVIVTMFDPENIRILPPEYVYPYNLHYDVPLDRRAKVLNDLVCIYYDGRSLRLDEIRDIEVLEPLRSWLAARQIAE